jgi:uncharacterized oxidoreductase
MKSRIFSADELRDLARRIFAAAGSNEREALKIATRLVKSNLVGHDSHGVIRIPRYWEWIKKGLVLPNRKVTFVLDRGPIVVLDGNSGFGQSTGEQTMEIAIDRARRHGCSLVGLRNTGHLGRIGDWPEMATAAGMLSLHFVNTSGMGNLVAPYGGKDRRLSANPIAFGVPQREGPPLIMDMSACMIAEGKVRVALHQGVRVPDGCLIDSEGRPTNDPELFYRHPPGSILPIAGHKGYILSFMIEMLAGALTGGSCTNPAYAHQLANGMFTIVIDRSWFADRDEFFDEVDRYVRYVKSARTIDPDGEILVPGELEVRTSERRTREGIPLAGTTIGQILQVCEELNIDSGWETG